MPLGNGAKFLGKLGKFFGKNSWEMPLGNVAKFLGKLSKLGNSVGSWVKSRPRFFGKL